MVGECRACGRTFYGVGLCDDCLDLDGPDPLRVEEAIEDAGRVGSVFEEERERSLDRWDR